MSHLERSIDQLLQVIQPAAVLRQQVATSLVIDRAGGIAPAALAPHLSPLVVRWGPSDTGRWPVARSGRAVMLWACAGTPPSTGDATITLTLLTAYSGSETIATLTIPQGDQIASEAITDDLPAGSWLGATVTTANGAANVSIAVTINVGGQS